MLKKLPASKLVPGMYIHSIIRCNSNFALKKPGWVTSQRSINALLTKGVLELEIDTDKTLPETEKPAEQEQQSSGSDTAEVTIEEELVQAKPLYVEAKQLQKKAWKDLEQGRQLNIEEFQTMSEDLIGSIFRNTEALTMLTRIREKDEYLLEHSLNVAILLGVFGKYLKLDEEVIQQIVLGGLLHDIGKIRIPPEVLHKPQRLTPGEFEIIKGHVLHGRDIIRESRVELSNPTLQVVLLHHETLNRTGYPHKLGEKDIGQYGRMASIVDIFDALTAERVYKKAMLPTAALSIIRSMAPDKLDNELVDSFIRCIHVYPVGTLVKLRSERLGIVYKLNEQSAVKPVVKLIYHTKHEQHIDPELLDLAHPAANDAIVSAEKAEAHGLDLKNYL